ncbi:MAG: TPM domain-containing protein [Lentisphaerae bacterium]|nr:TPM domain-containing protein [Lentisphaerota bacterium]
MAKFFNKEDERQILDAIKDAESDTSGEIRVHIQERCKGDPIETAKKVFERIGMTSTEKRNGVLFFLAYADRKFAILGDKGIDDAVPDDFWRSIVETVISHFKEGRFTHGLRDGILETGRALKKYFPYQSDDVNELKDEISHG